MGSNILSMLGFVTSRTATAHPQYNPVDRANDIGVITLPVSLVITANVAPIALPPLDSAYGYPFENEQGTIVGFGFTDAAGKNLFLEYAQSTSSRRLITTLP